MLIPPPPFPSSIKIDVSLHYIEASCLLTFLHCSIFVVNPLFFVRFSGEVRNSVRFSTPLVVLACLCRSNEWGAVVFFQLIAWSPLIAALIKNWISTTIPWWDHAEKRFHCHILLTTSGQAQVISELPARVVRRRLPLGICKVLVRFCADMPTRSGNTESKITPLKFTI